MEVSKAVEILLEYHRSSSRRNTIRAYEAILGKFCVMSLAYRYGHSRQKALFFLVSYKYGGQLT